MVMKIKKKTWIHLYSTLTLPDPTMEYSIQNTNIWQSGLSDNDLCIFLM